jgi:hypothetical protein
VCCVYNYLKNKLLRCVAVCEIDNIAACLAPGPDISESAAAEFLCVFCL